MLSLSAPISPIYNVALISRIFSFLFSLSSANLFYIFFCFMSSCLLLWRLVLNHLIKTFEFIAICLVCFMVTFFWKIYLSNICFFYFFPPFSYRFVVQILCLVFWFLFCFVLLCLFTSICRKQLGQWTELIAKLLCPECVYLCVVCAK